MAEVLSKLRSRRSGSDLLQNGGCCGSSTLAIVVPRRSWRGIFRRKLQRVEISWDEGDVALVPRFPGIRVHRKKTQTASVPKKTVSLEGCTSADCAQYCAHQQARWSWTECDP